MSGHGPPHFRHTTSRIHQLPLPAGRLARDHRRRCIDWRWYDGYCQRPRGQTGSERNCRRCQVDEPGNLPKSEFSSLHAQRPLNHPARPALYWDFIRHSCLAQRLYIRRVRIGKNEVLYDYLSINHPELLEDDLLNNKQGIITIPQQAPEGSTLRTEEVMELLERIKRFNTDWVRNGFRRGCNANNVSATVSILKTTGKRVGEWMWENKASYNGLSVLPFDLETISRHL